MDSVVRRCLPFVWRVLICALSGKVRWKRAYSYARVKACLYCAYSYRHWLLRCALCLTGACTCTPRHHTGITLRIPNWKAFCHCMHAPHLTAPSRLRFILILHYNLLAAAATLSASSTSLLPIVKIENCWGVYHWHTIALLQRNKLQSVHSLHREGVCHGLADP